MARSEGRPVTADQRVRDLQKEARAIEREPAGPDRAARLAAVARAAHDDRLLNLAMHTATIALEDDPQAPRALVDAYLCADADAEAQLHCLDDLRDLARYLERPDVTAIAEQQLEQVAYDYVAEAEAGERRYRLRTVQSLTSRELADRLRDRLDPPPGG